MRENENKKMKILLLGINRKKYSDSVIEFSGHKNAFRVWKGVIHVG